MKRRRAARDGAASKTTALPPPIPEFDELDARAASDVPTVEAAWWISHQVSEHVFAIVSRGDPRTGEPLSRPLTEILRDLRAATAMGCRPFPHDRLLMAAEFAADSLAHLLHRHRHRIVRVHEQLPFHQLREVDTRSMAWLARQPGRNIREKLSGRTHALGVKRAVSADTTENRLLRSFAKLLVQRANLRLDHRSAYDEGTADAERVGRLEECLQLCDARLRRSELADVPTLTRLRPNNVILSDPHYSRVFRAWKWLRDDEEALRGSWKDTLQRTRILLCWMVAAQLATRERIVVADTLARVFTGRDDERRLGVEVLGAHAGGADWSLNPPLHFLVLPSGQKDPAFRIRLALDGEFVRAHISTLGGRGLLTEQSVSALAFEMRPTSEHLQPQRGIGIAVDGMDASGHGADRTFADLAGLAPVAAKMARQILQHCNVNQNIERRERPAQDVEDGARLGIELGTASMHIHVDRALSSASAPWALALEVPDGAGGVDWLEGRTNRDLMLGAAGQSLKCTGDVLDAEEQVDAGVVALAADRILNSIASELRLPTDARVAYTVPDAVDEFSQRSLRSAFTGSFHRPVPVWRSVAAAISWASAGERGPRPGESVVILDTEFGGVSLTVLTARHDKKLEEAHPSSRGIYWERKPPLPPDEQLEMLGWPHVLRAYARELVGRELGSMSPELQDRVVEDLLGTGKLDRLVAHGGSIFVQVPSNQCANPDVVEFFEDSVWLDEAVARWIERIDRSVTDALSGLGKILTVLIGGPSAYSRFQGTRRQTGRIKFFNGEKSFGFIVSDEGGAEVFFHRSAVEIPEWVELRRDLAVEFDVGRGRRGPEAQHITSVSPLVAWLRRRAVVTPEMVAAGARECLLRLDTGSLAWREWLPELSLEVVRDGHFGELPLLERGTFVDPFLGEAVQFTVPESLTLGRGHRWFSFPLLVGRQGRRPVAWEARLDSPAFPLDDDVGARLRLSYRYGLDNSYELAVEPASEDDATFRPVKAKWVKGGEGSTTTLTREPLARSIKPWTAKEEKYFYDFVRNGCRRFFDNPGEHWRLDKVRTCWSEGRSLATAPRDVQRDFLVLRNQLLGSVPHDMSARDVPPALIVLSLFHEDAPQEVVGWLSDRDEHVGDDVEAFRQTAAMIATLVGDGTGERTALLYLLLDRLRRHGQGDSFNASLASHTMRALGNAAWRHPGFVNALAAAPRGASTVIAQCRRSLHNLMSRIPFDVSSDEQRQQVSAQFGTPFRDVCELLLALMAVDPVDPVVASLRTGSASADSFAKLVRQVDARLASIGARPKWRVRLDVTVPRPLHRMSRVAYALNTYLAEGAGANLVRVESAEVD